MQITWEKKILSWTPGWWELYSQQVGRGWWGRRASNGSLWSIPNPDECGWHKHLHEASRDEWKRSIRPDLHRTRKAQSTTNWTQCHDWAGRSQQKNERIEVFLNMFSMKPETHDGLSSCSSFAERPTETELAANKLVLSEIEHLKSKISDKELDSLREVLNRNADVLSQHKADIGCCNFVESEKEIEEGSVPQREGATRVTQHKSEAY